MGEPFELGGQFSGRWHLLTMMKNRDQRLSVKLCCHHLGSNPVFTRSVHGARPARSYKGKHNVRLFNFLVDTSVKVLPNGDGLDIDENTCPAVSTAKPPSERPDQILAVFSSIGDKDFGSIHVYNFSKLGLTSQLLALNLD